AHLAAGLEPLGGGVGAAADAGAVRPLAAVARLAALALPGLQAALLQAVAGALLAAGLTGAGARLAARLLAAAAVVALLALRRRRYVALGGRLRRVLARARGLAAIPLGPTRARLRRAVARLGRAVAASGLLGLLRPARRALGLARGAPLVGRALAQRVEVARQGRLVAGAAVGRLRHRRRLGALPL